MTAVVGIASNSKGDGLSTYYEGLEIGSVSVKWVRRDNRGHTMADIRVHEGDPRRVIQNIFEGRPATAASTIAVTGQAAKVLLDLPYRPESECIERALAHLELSPDILLSLGGETFSLFTLKKGMVNNIISSSKCAAGTGEFIVQQFQRMGLRLEEGLKTAASGRFVQLATRCSVHCKSDATHKLNKGECKPEDIAKSLIYDLAKKVGKMVEIAQWPAKTILICGGVSRNRSFVNYLKEIVADSELRIVEQSPYLEAFGASLLAAEEMGHGDFQARQHWVRSSNIELDTLKPLTDAEDLLDYRVKPDCAEDIVDGASYILGVDAGSTTTKVVLFNVSDGAVGARCYLRTLGNPVQATKNCLKELIRQVGDKSIRIVQAGVTGSGREMVSVYLGNCLHFNEILAHARGASENVPEVDTVFEIGGQDSKFISFLKGVPIDYEMNEGCSAGTGSFLEESAAVDMGVLMRDISAIARQSKCPIAFGERCAAFINTDLRNALQQGARQEDVIAGLVYSIADNYISRIVGSRHIGENLLFLGGVALNKAVALAMAARTKRKIVVPAYPELMGSIGTALMARDLLLRSEAPEMNYSLIDLAKGDITVKGAFTCNTCENKCEIQKISIRDKSYPFGGLCSKYDRIRRSGKDGSFKEGQDLIGVRNKLMFEEFGPKEVGHSRGAIGIPMALTAFELFPFFSKLINELGYDVVLSKISKEGNSKSGASICYPCEIAHGAVYDLIQRDVDYIFLPRVLGFEFGKGYRHGYTCPSTTVIPDVIAATFGQVRDKLLCPHIGLSKDLLDATVTDIENMRHKLGLKKKEVSSAAQKALSHYRHFEKRYRKIADTSLRAIRREPAVVIAGRPYATCSPEVNLALPRKITSKGYHAIPADMLPEIGTGSHPRNVWYFTQQIANAINHVRNSSNLYICLLSCFSCGPDASVFHLFRQELSGHTFCYLEIDSHTAHAGFETRVEAFLDIIEARHRKVVASG